MGLFTKDIKNMEDLFAHTLRDIYYAEKQIVKALPDMITKATDPQLKQGFQTHLRGQKTTSSASSRCSSAPAKMRKALTVRPSTGLSRKPMRSPAKSTKRRCLMLLLSRQRKRSNTTR